MMAGASIGTNQELTEQILKMQGQLASFEAQLNGLITPMQDEINKSRAISDQMTKELNERILPLLQADLKTVIEKVNADAKGMIKQPDDRVAELMKSVQTNDANSTIVQDAMSA